MVGTVKHYALDKDSRVTAYYPHDQIGFGGLYFAVKTAGDPEALVATVKRTAHELDANVAVIDVVPMAERLAESLAERRFSMALLQAFSAIALLLAAVGIYGLVSYRVSQGAHELGMRMALGASTNKILKLVLRHGLALASIGVVIGLAVASGVTRLMRSMLYGVNATDGATFAAVSAALVLTTVIACYVPARRATKVDPLAAIRAE